MKRIITSIFMTIAISGSLLAKSVYHQATPQNLFAAAEAGNKRAIKRILTKGISINTLNDQGKTLLDIIIERGDISYARDLASDGARVTNEINAQILRDNFNLRALTYFIVGFLFMPLLWIGTIVSLYKASNVIVLIKSEDDYSHYYAPQDNNTIITTSTSSQHNTCVSSVKMAIALKDETKLIKV